MENSFDIHFMSLALALAEKGRGTTTPNPMVGALVVRDGMIVGKGHHVQAGKDHAEIVALREAGMLARGATLYVTLEPCCHRGKKTPPCTTAIIQSGIRRVVAAMTDVNPLVSGRGFQTLRKHNIRITHNVLEQEARVLNEVYCKYITTKTPFIILKLAVTLDGYIADVNGNSAWISGEESRYIVQQMRSWYDADMVGIGTVLKDNPRLTVRDIPGKNPLRIIVDSQLSIPENTHVFDDSNVIIACTDIADKEKEKRLRDRGITVWIFPDSDRIVPLDHLICKLGEREITSVLCEGGSALACSLLASQLVDKLVLFKAPKVLGKGLAMLGELPFKYIDNALTFENVHWSRTGTDMMMTGYPSIEKTARHDN